MSENDQYYKWSSCVVPTAVGNVVVETCEGKNLKRTPDLSLLPNSTVNGYKPMMTEAASSEVKSTSVSLLSPASTSTESSSDMNNSSDSSTRKLEESRKLSPLIFRRRATTPCDCGVNQQTTVLVDKNIETQPETRNVSNQTDIGQSEMRIICEGIFRNEEVEMQSISTGTSERTGDSNESDKIGERVSIYEEGLEVDDETQTPLVLSNESFENKIEDSQNTIKQCITGDSAEEIEEWYESSIQWIIDNNTNAETEK